MELALWLLTLPAGAVPLLGHDEYAVREQASELLGNPLWCVLLPRQHADAEIDHRIKRLRARCLRELDPEYRERVTYRDDFPGWVRLYLATGRSLIAPVDVFSDVHADWNKAMAVFAALPVQPGEYQSFLIGSIVDGEYERWLEFLDYHHARAPLPREVLQQP